MPSLDNNSTTLRAKIVTIRESLMKFTSLREGTDTSLTTKSAQSWSREPASTVTWTRSLISASKSMTSSSSSMRSKYHTCPSIKRLYISSKIKFNLNSPLNIETSKATICKRSFPVRRELLMTVISSHSASMRIIQRRATPMEN